MKKYNLKKIGMWIGIIFVIQTFNIAMVFAAFREVQKITEHKRMKIEIKNKVNLLKEKIIYELESLHRVSEFVAWNKEVYDEYDEISNSKLQESLKKIKYKIMANNLRKWVVNLKIKEVEIEIADGKNMVSACSSGYPASDIDLYTNKHVAPFGETRDFIEVVNGTVYLKSVSPINENGRIIVSKNIEKFLDDSKETLKSDLVLLTKINKKQFIATSTIFSGGERIKEKTLENKDITEKERNYKIMLLNGNRYEFTFENLVDSELHEIGLIGCGYSLKDLNDKYGVIKFKILASILMLGLLSTIVLTIVFEKILKLFSEDND